MSSDAKEYLSVYTDSDNEKLAGNFTNIIPILISRSMKVYHHL